MEQVRKVPWRTWDEWVSVYRLLTTDRFSAFSHLELWQSRSSLPILIDCTRLLLCVSQHTCGNCNFSGLQDTEPVRLMLGMCVLRVVNQVTDLHQKSRNAIPIAAVAGNIDLPEWIVDVRHGATHGELPGLFLLEKAVRDLYAYLIQTYWTAQYEVLTQLEASIETRFHKYLRKAKHCSDSNVLMKCAAEAFKHEEVLKDQCEWLPKKAIEMYSLVQEESWVPLVAHLHTHVPGFSTLCVLSGLDLIESDVSKLPQMKSLLEALVSVSPGVQVPVTRSVKHILTLQNTNEDAFELVAFLLDSTVFPVSVMDGIRLIHAHAFVSPETPDLVGLESSHDVDMKKWTRVKYWSEKAIGTCSVQNTNVGNQSRSE